MLAARACLPRRGGRLKNRFLASGHSSMTPPSDETLLRQIAAQDRPAFAAFYDRHAPRVYGLIRKLLGPSAEADDVLQEVFSQVWKQAERYDQDRSAPLSWLLLLARSRALDHLRRRKNLPAAAETLPEAMDLQTPSQPLVATERTLKMFDLLERLPQEQRQAIMLAFYGGLTQAEVAEKQGAPLGTVKTRIRQGMLKLREWLSAAGEASA